MINDKELYEMKEKIKGFPTEEEVHEWYEEHGLEMIKELIRWRETYNKMCEIIDGERQTRSPF